VGKLKAWPGLITGVRQVKQGGVGHRYDALRDWAWGKPKFQPTQTVRAKPPSAKENRRDPGLAGIFEGPWPWLNLGEINEK